MLRKIANFARVQGPIGTFKAISQRLLPLPMAGFPTYAKMLQGACGIEVGGPSTVFGRRGLFPIYSLARRVDNCNFSEVTMWQDIVSPGCTFKYDTDKDAGNQYIREATSLVGIDTASYDFLLSSHVLEHIANPIKALLEWTRVIRDDGLLILFLPHKMAAFDHRRPVTTFRHLVEDFESEALETDLTHLAEILRLHDLTRDSGALTFDSFRERAENNYQNRGLHHHVFDLGLVKSIFNFVHLQVLDARELRPHHIFVVGQK